MHSGESTPAFTAFANRRGAVSFSGASGYLVAAGGKIQATAVEVDRVDEVLFVAGAAGRVLHLLDPGISGSRGQWLSVFLRDWEDYGYQEAWSGIYRPHFTVMDVNRAPCDGQS
jgi:hypothetical protein